MRYLFIIVFLALLFFISTKPIFAIYDPTSVSNNRFGIHIADTPQLPDAARLVNTNGDWGYVTFVIQETERKKGRWQAVFDEARRLHLIPIVRVATQPEDGGWKKPKDEDVNGWVDFLNSLNWVVKNRYIIVGNEPNHAKEWGKEVNPEEYTTYLKTFSQKLKERSADFFVLPAGLDASAPTSRSLFQDSSTLDEAIFIRRMLEAEPDLFDHLDGWTSHSYPNPDFSGSEFASGRGTIRTYEWELAYLEGLGVSKDLPVFITETGWAHNMGENKNGYTDPESIGKKLGFAFEHVWNDEKVVAVTPFVLGYLEPPFDIFSWKDKSGDFYSFYQDVQSLAKVKGTPLQENKGIVEGIFVFPLYPTDSIYKGVVLVKNTGQSIWNKNGIGVVSDKEEVKITATSFENLEPGQSGVISFESKTPSQTGIQNIPLWLERNGELFGEPYYFKIITIFSINMKIEPIFDKIWSLGP